MKKILSILLFCGSVLAVSCDRLLEIQPKDKQTTTTAFKTYQNFKTYAWGLYSVFSSGSEDAWNKDIVSHVMVNNNSTNNNSFAYQNVTEATNNSYWTYSYIRRVNVMLDCIDNSEMSDPDKEHWRSVGLFFRSMKYYDLLSKYGGVPWVDHVIGEADEDILYGPRATRDVTAENLLKDLKYAEEHIYENGDGANTINRKVVQALLSRFTLFEGTWRKYHGLADAEKYLNECVTYSKKLIDAMPTVADNYGSLFTSESLAGKAGVILYFEYSDEAGLTHQGGRQAGASGNSYEATKYFIDSYLCLDGKPIATSPLYEGDKTPYKEFRNRDRRLHFTIVPPYRLKGTGNNDRNSRPYMVGETVKMGLNTYTVTYQDSVDFTENIELMKVISSGTKTLPGYAWNNSTVSGYMPRFRANPEQGGNPFTGYHGYWFWKYYNTADCLAKHAQNTTDIAKFRIEETMLNYAEAMCELGRFDQTVADLTINKLRPRAGVAAMNVAEITDAFDPNRDQTVPAFLWEIRRERTIELIAENFAFDDLRRWKKGHYLDKQMLGCWVKNSDYNNKLRIYGFKDVASSANQEGYVVYRAEPKGYLDHYDLYPIPIKELVLNPQLEQNPGYKDASSAQE